MTLCERHTNERLQRVHNESVTQAYSDLQTFPQTAGWAWGSPHLGEQLLLCVAQQAEGQEAVDGGDGAVWPQQEEAAQGGERPRGPRVDGGGGGWDGGREAKQVWVLIEKAPQGRVSFVLDRCSCQKKVI